MKSIDKFKYKRLQWYVRNGQPDKAVVLLEELAASYPYRGDFLAMLAKLEWDAGDLEGAERRFAKAVRFSPNSERISIGFFHLLLRLGREGEAFDEARRFLSRNCSDEYMRVLSAIKKPEA